jgi:DNA-binding IclR family transcriptional regulator
VFHDTEHIFLVDGTMHPRLSPVNGEIDASESTEMIGKVTTLASHEDDGAEATVKTVDRAARLLRSLAGHPEGAMLSAVARETGLGKATVHRLLNALIDAGLAFQDYESKLYRLGTGLALLGHAAHRQDLATSAKPFLLRLAEQTQDTIYASVREGGAAVCVAREIGAFPIRTLSLDVGHLRPLGVGSGSLALFASLPDQEIAAILDKNVAWLARYPGHSRKEMLAKVTETRRRGYSFIEGKIVPGMNAMGVAILGADGRPAAALSLAAITDRVSGPRVGQLARMLAREAAELAKAMGLPTAAAARTLAKQRA